MLTLRLSGQRVSVILYLRKYYYLVKIARTGAKLWIMKRKIEFPSSSYTDYVILFFIDVHNIIYYTNIYGECQTHIIIVSNKCNTIASILRIIFSCQCCVYDYLLGSNEQNKHRDFISLMLRTLRLI